nr:MAG TPA: hypothetical protein [Caudoviricetes sp.]
MFPKSGFYQDPKTDKECAILFHRKPKLSCDLLN